MKKPIRYLLTALGTIAFVVVVLAVVTVINVPLSPRPEAMRKAAEASLAAYEVALGMYRDDCGSFPTEDQGLDALVRNPGIDRWKGPYVRPRPPADSWGNPFAYGVGATSVTITSCGSDGKLGTADDLVKKIKR
jgi:general secretion pathway protein G